MALHLAIIIGSIRAGRLGPVVADWFRDRAEQHRDFRVDLIDPADCALPDRHADSAETAPAVVRELGERLHKADAFVMVTPEYNHSYPAALKNVIDWYVDEWRAKPVGFVSYGGVAGGLRAVEALRLVFPELHATTIRDGVCFTNVWERLDESGRLTDTARADKAADVMLAQLAWWATALRNHRHAEPYRA
ncbi:NADPH-dependent FMN reductase [Nocardia carnea]|uniref:NADPH-dependent FMN reductase n=1 Tax=Nocardia carnea TaxID=37328 RepID=UPI0024567515|nr:NAD(P)H-dependent oxidoreductase [Nocardia carnea]